MQSWFDLQDRVAIVTGGASGLGFAIASGLLRHGGRVVIASRNLTNVNEAVQRLSQIASSQRVIGTSCDVTDGPNVEEAMHLVVEKFGRLDILVHSAGSILRKPTFDLSTEEFSQMYDTHVTGALRCAKAAGRFMRDHGGGSVIHIASVASFVDLIEVAAYTSAKNALLGLTRSLANEWAKYNIRVNAVASGFVLTDLNRGLLVNTDRGRRVIERTPMGRFGVPDEIAAAAVFLASPAASFVTGHTLVVDGGFLACGIGDSVCDWNKMQPDEPSK